DNFNHAILATIDRHEILRTVFKTDKTGEIRQWILSTEEVGFKMDFHDYREVEDKDAAVNNYINEDSYKDFDLENGPLLRAALLQVDDEEFILYYNMHHIISDGWSIEVLTRDVSAFYDALQTDTEPDLKELRVQFKDYSAWQLDQLASESFKEHKNFWLEKLSGELAVLDLPATRKRPSIKTYSGRGLGTYISKKTSKKLKAYSKSRGGSLFMSLLSAWDVLMYKYTGQTDLIIGTPIVGREHTDLEDQVGFYVNTLILRNQLNPQHTYDEFYESYKINALNSYAHQMYPVDRLIEELDLQRDTSRSAVFDMLVTLQNIGENIAKFELTEEEADEITLDKVTSTSKFDINITFEELGDYIFFHLIYNPDVYDEDMVRGLMRHYRQLIDALLANPDKQITELDYFSKEERTQLISGFNGPSIAYPFEKTIVSLFEEQVTKTPGHTALVFEDTALSYTELNQRVNQLSSYLTDNYDIQNDDLIGIRQKRSDWVIVSMLAILKSGGAYVPIDPEYPENRIAFMVKDSNCKVVLDEDELLKFGQQQSRYSIDNNNRQITDRQLAYVIYTSGTTGQPKGVMITHRSMLDYSLTFRNTFKVDHTDKVIHQSSISFDTHVEEIYPTLLSGATLLIGRNGGRDIGELEHLIQDNKASILSATPLILQELNTMKSDLSGLRLLISGGDKFSAAFVSNYIDTLSIYDTYGPSESTVCTTYSEVDSQETRTIIGEPITNRTVHILSNNNELQPVGVAGEICIGGEGLARGYMNREDLTSEKFIANPFRTGERLYKTGDLGRWLPDGKIEFLGRKDDQVKVRGYRIELAEIEQVLISHDLLDNAVVLARDNAEGEKELVAYLVAAEEQNTNKLRAYLKEQLPAYMVPSYFVQLVEIPLTANGKVDKKALPAPEGLGIDSGVEYVAPRNELEEQLVRIWQSVLQKEKIGIHHDFFALGGHSLKALRLSNEYQKVLDVKVSLQDLFTQTSIADHVALVNASATMEFEQISPVALQENYPMSDSQRRLWVLSQFEGGSRAYNMPLRTNLNGDYDIESFKKAVEATVDRHEILRTVFKADDSGDIKQWIYSREEIGFEITYIDYRDQEEAQQKVDRYIAEDAYKAFDLENGPLLKAALLRLADEEYVFYYNMHHIISDGWSIEVLSRDVAAFYDAYHFEKEPELNSLRIQFKDYSSWQQDQLSGKAFEAHRNYWLEQLSGELPILELPGSNARPAVKTYNGQGLRTYIDKTTTSKLKEFARVNRGSIFMGLLASWNVLMHRYT
ncbi:MAG: amino acid adenylation domain-containing protein, partial [Cyclobacteriaceae bacterium]